MIHDCFAGGSVFIRQDAIQGMCLLGYFLVCLAIGVWATRKKDANGKMLILFSFIWSVSPIWTLFIILWKSDDIFDPEKARTSWSTFDSYLGDPLRWGWVPILLVLLIVHLLRRWKDQKGSLAS